MAEHAWRLSVRNETIPRRRRGNQGEACIIDEWTQTAIDARGGSPVRRVACSLGRQL